MTNQKKDANTAGTTAAEKSPNEVLAAKVLAALAEADLIEPADVTRLQEKVATGKLDGSGWRLAFENRIERRASPEKLEEKGTAGEQK